MYNADIKVNQKDPYQQKKERKSIMAEERELCSVCARNGKKSEHPMCSECNRRFDAKVVRAQREGQVVLVSRIDYARMKARETLARLSGELQSAREDKGKLYPQAKEQVKAEFVAAGTITIASQELNRQVGKKFGELLGDPARAGEIFGIINNHPGFIASIQNFLRQENVSEPEEKAVA